MKKLILITALILVFCIGFTSFAYAGSAEYHGECWNNFFTSASVSGNDNGSTANRGSNVCYYDQPGYDTYYIGTTAYTDYTSRLYQNNSTSNTAMGILWMAANLLDNWHTGPITSTYSSYWGKVSNSHTAYKLHAQGLFEAYYRSN